MLRHRPLPPCRAPVAGCLLFALCATAVFGHGDVMRIGATAAGGGRLEIEPGFDFDRDVLVTEVTSVGNQTLFHAIIPSLAWVLPGSAALQPVNPTASIAMRIEQIDAGASVRLNGRILDAPGESANIGTFSADPEEHVHPEWRLILPTGVAGRYSVSFVLITATPGYLTSPVYTLVLSNLAPTETTTPTATETRSAKEETATPSPAPTESTGPAPSASATSTATQKPAASPGSTPAPPVCPGDCDGDLEVTIDELVRAVGIALETASVGTCPPSDSNADGEVTVDELVRAVNVALRGCPS